MLERIAEQLAEIETRSAELKDELEALVAESEFDQDAFDDLNTRAEQLETEYAELEGRRAKIELRMERLAKIQRNATAGNVEAGDGAGAPVYKRQMTDDDLYNLDTLAGFGEKRRSDLQARAITAVERTSGWEFEHDVTGKADRSKDRIVRLLERHDDAKGTIANLVLATNSQLYKRAWTKAVTGRESFLTGPERDVLGRAMSLTDAGGGYAIPMPIDPTLIQLGDGAYAGVRNYARVETTTVDVWRGLTSTQLSASWDGEAAEVSDDTTTFAQPSISVHKAQAFVPASIEIAQDYPALASDLAALFADGKNRLESAAFATGDGSSKPYGIVTALTAGTLTSATTDTFALADVFTLHETLGPRYRAPGRGAWASNIAILNDVRAFGANDQTYGFTVDLTEGEGFQILGRPWFEMSDMDGSVTATQDNYVLIFGDWSNYVIVDRVGMAVEYIPHLFATANNLPSGQRGWYAYWRVGADSVNDGAFEMMNVT